MSVNRKAVVIYGSTDLWVYWDKADKLRLFYRDISHNLCTKQMLSRTEAILRNQARAGDTRAPGLKIPKICEARISLDINVTCVLDAWSVPAGRSRVGKFEEKAREKVLVCIQYYILLTASEYRTGVKSSVRPTRTRVEAATAGRDRIYII